MTELQYKSMTKQEFANMLGVSTRTLNRWILRVDADLLQQVGYHKRDHFLPPKVVAFLCQQFVCEQFSTD